MKKAIKIIVGAVVAVVALVLILVLTLPLWLGPVVKPVANAAVPKITQTDFRLGHLYLNPYTGRFEIGDMLLGNPANYDEKRAVTLDKIALDVAMTTLASEYIHVEEVTVDGVFVSYVDADGVNNFQQIQYNVAGGKEKYEAKQAQAKADKAKAESEKIEEPEKKADDGSSKKLVIDKLVINNIKFKYGPITIPVPSVTLTDLGKKSDGLTFAELGDQIMQAILKSATALGDGVKALGGALGDGAKKLGEGAGKAVGAVSDIAGGSVKAVSEGADKAVGAVSDVAGGSVKAVGDGAGKAVDAVGEGAKKVGEGANKAVDAVGEGAKKAADALKSLF